MEVTTTRIMDLPENITLQMGGGAGSAGTDMMSPTQYAPINIHPNPYASSASVPSFMPNPQQVSSGSKNGAVVIPPAPQTQYMTEEYVKQMQHQRLPSRDIPKDMTEYTQDQEIQANYIPKPAVSSQDYIKEQEYATEKNRREYESKKKRENQIDAILTEWQTPFVVALLFFIFQMPIVNTMIFKRFSFLAVVDTDGHFNFYGLFLKSALFGIAFYSIFKTVDWISGI